MIALAFLASIIVLVVISSILRGYVLSVLWGWFVVPTFGLPALSIPIAIGISLILAFTTHQISVKKEEDKSFGTQFSNIILYPLLTLAIGWIVTLFI